MDNTSNEMMINYSVNRPVIHCKRNNGNCDNRIAKEMPETSGSQSGLLEQLMSDLEAGAESDLVDAGVALTSAGLFSDLASPGTAAAGDDAPPLKSVAYQPEPLSWKPAAVSCLANAGAPQCGQTVNGASDIFCKTSLAWPQDSHL